MTAALTAISGTISGAGTLSLAGTGAPSSLTNQYSSSATLTSFTGIIDIQGARFQSPTQVGLGAIASISATNGGQFYANGSVTYTTPLTISGIGWTQENLVGQGNALGALRLQANTYAGPITLSGDASIANSTSTGTITGVIGETGGARVLTLGNSNLLGLTTLTLNPTSANTYSGGTLIDHAIVNANASGSFGTGTVTLQTTGTNISQVSRLVVASVLVQREVDESVGWR